ncbi:hypothetical protein KBTX_04053 [wastewater metagenome]|uniref:O-antigen ligase-related domain-containing protein n=3 Tax=root TaxID=1 RepID=A0A5B8RIY1_9ZZZZ|nr:O-antigen ligase family protein [Arhodomonas sp. KWT]QEA07692.1 hypothetical protein KBTEX_04053 [uncultured organism]
MNGAGGVSMTDLLRLRAGAIAQVLVGEGPAFALVCLYVFIEYVRPQSIYPAIDVLPYAQVSILAALVARLASRERIDLDNPVTRLLAVFLVVLQFAWWDAWAPMFSGERVVTHVVWGIVFFLVVTTVTTRQRFFVFLFLYLLWNLKMSQHGFRSWAARGFGYDNWGVTGAPGWFQNSGELGIQMCIFLPLSLYFMAAVRPWCARWKWLLLAFLPLSAVATIIATNSRGAVVGAAAAFAWMALTSRRRVRIALLAIVITIVGYSVMPEQTLERFDAAGQDETSQNRLLRWQIGWEIMQEHPWLGIGPANWGPYYQTHYPPEEGLERYGLPHSIFVDAGAEYGFTGLTLFALMILYAFLNNRRTRRMARAMDDRMLVTLAGGMDAAMVGLLVSSSFVSVFFYPYFWVHIAFIVALNKVAAAAYARHEATAPAVAGAVTQALTTGGRTWRRA